MFVGSIIAPALRAAVVVPHDLDPLPGEPKALFVGTGGTLTLRGAEGEDVVLKNVPNAALLPFRALFVRATGTTAADIVALY